MKRAVDPTRDLNNHCMFGRVLPGTPEATLSNYDTQMHPPPRRPAIYVAELPTGPKHPRGLPTGPKHPRRLPTGPKHQQATGGCPGGSLSCRSGI